MQEYNVVVETKPGTFEEVLATDDMTLQQLAEECQENYRDRIVLANVNRRLRELNKKVTDGAIVSFLNMTERDGKRTYRRSVTLLLQKAVDNLWGDSVHVRVFYSLGEGYYCELENDSIDDEKLAAIVTENAETIKAGVLALDVALADAAEGAYTKDWSINGIDATLSVRKASSWGAVDPASVKVRYWASLSEPAETLSPTAATDNGDGTITVEIAIPEGNSGFLQAVME